MDYAFDPLKEVRFSEINLYRGTDFLSYEYKGFLYPPSYISDLVYYTFNDPIAYNFLSDELQGVFRSSNHVTVLGDYAEPRLLADAVCRYIDEKDRIKALVTLCHDFSALEKKIRCAVCQRIIDNPLHVAASVVLPSCDIFYTEDLSLTLGYVCDVCYAGVATFKRWIETSVTFSFSAVHFLSGRDYGGVESTLHGHKWDVTLTFIYPAFASFDVRAVSNVCEGFLRRLDKNFLNLHIENPTVGGVAFWIAQRALLQLPLLRSVTVKEDTGLCETVKINTRIQTSRDADQYEAIGDHCWERTF